MSDPEKRQKLFYSRAQHQLRQIQFSCREVVTLSQNIKMMNGQISDSDINCKKIEFIKTEIKQKLKDVASNIDQIYKILDKKIVILINQLKKQSKNQSNIGGTNSDSANSSMNRINVADKNTQKTYPESQQSSLEQERAFSDTLNPRVTQLQTKLIQYEQRQGLLNAKIDELKTKNSKLIEEFNRLSTASNKKINELSLELNNLTSRDKDSFSSLQHSEHSRRKNGEKYKPFLTFDLQPDLPARSPKKHKDMINFSPEDEFFNANNDSIANEKNRPFTFGCMPTRQPQKEQTSASNLTFQNYSNDNFQNLDKEDRNRRFDILLNKLRYTDQPESKTQQKAPSAKANSGQQITSVFSKEVVRRYQV